MSPTLAVLASIPSPPESVWYLGPLPLRAYAIAILIGIVLAWWILDRRYTARGGPEEVSVDVALWMVPFGIIGGRIYHVVSSPDAYFGPDGDPVRALYLWQGGLGIWGAIALGAVGAWIGLRRRGLRVAPFADALAPGLLVAQAVGRLGNYFNQELYGAPTTVPWGLEIDQAHRVPGFEDPGLLFHPTFLYELLWNLAAAAVLVWAARRFHLRHGRVFWLYVMLYTLGRVWIEYLRIDDAEQVLGLRLNVWTSVIVFLGALVAFVVLGMRKRGQPDPIWLPGREPEDATTEDAPTGTPPGAAVGTGSEDRLAAGAGTGDSEDRLASGARNGDSEDRLAPGTRTASSEDQNGSVEAGRPRADGDGEAPSRRGTPD